VVERPKTNKQALIYIAIDGDANRLTRFKITRFPHLHIVS